jgi:hypothetical protein
VHWSVQQSVELSVLVLVHWLELPMVQLWAHSMAQLWALVSVQLLVLLLVHWLEPS